MGRSPSCPFLSEIRGRCGLGLAGRECRGQPAGRRQDHRLAETGAEGGGHSADVPEMVTISRAELDALHSELRRLRREVGRSIAAARIPADLGPGDDARLLSREQLTEAWG